MQDLTSTYSLTSSSGQYSASSSLSESEGPDEGDMDFGDPVRRSLHAGSPPATARLAGSALDSTVSCSSASSDSDFDSDSESATTSAGYSTDSSSLKGPSPGPRRPTRPRGPATASAMLLSTAASDDSALMASAGSMPSPHGSALSTSSHLSSSMDSLTASADSSTIRLADPSATTKNSTKKSGRARGMSFFSRRLFTGAPAAPALSEPTPTEPALASPFGDSAEDLGFVTLADADGQSATDLASDRRPNMSRSASLPLNSLVNILQDPHTQPTPTAESDLGAEETMPLSGAAASQGAASEPLPAGAGTATGTGSQRSSGRGSTLRRTFRLRRASLKNGPAPTDDPHASNLQSVSMLAATDTREFISIVSYTPVSGMYTSGIQEPEHIIETKIFEVRSLSTVASLFYKRERSFRASFCRSPD
ncbi:hypothetical protein H696_00677 [Fonticula alba]|uniref:Uncharacterized protein n=1 Tax=Fonticula alba TaxID=691883 RepID=A0A058ZFJ8_FONAL|nr:hypothetical protein H696_00677 [Fonticula alba]KCV73129.1 hypothetical protein H696_00677 [Fonticula alba]|eukprot:XP_009492830.1 hypothetical protein H696_00677 [Fonticula alba]